MAGNLSQVRRIAQKAIHSVVEYGVRFKQLAEGRSTNHLRLADKTDRRQGHGARTADWRIQLIQTISERDGVDVVEDDPATARLAGNLELNRGAALARPRRHGSCNLRTAASGNWTRIRINEVAYGLARVRFHPAHWIREKHKLGRETARVLSCAYELAWHGDERLSASGSVYFRNERSLSPKCALNLADISIERSSVGNLAGAGTSQKVDFVSVNRAFDKFCARCVFYNRELAHEIVSSMQAPVRSGIEI